jgi:hypothetical protein
MGMDWTEIELYKEIDLTDSFVMDWCFESDRLSFELEASIWPGSKYYTEPKAGEFTCYRKATLQFVGVQNVSGLKPKEEVPFSTDPDGTIDYGNIEGLEAMDGTFSLSGDFGLVNIIGGELRFEIHT